MRILQLLPALHVGGVETGVLDLCRYLKTAGHEPYVVSSGGGLVEELQKEGIRHILLPVQKKSLLSIIRCIRKLRRVIKNEDIAIVHARSRVPFWVGFFATRGTNAVLMATMHGCYRPTLFSRIVRWIGHIICPSDFAANYFKDVFGVSFQKITIIPRWVDTKKFTYVPYEQRSSIDHTLCYVGRLSSSKGIEYLLRALVKVKRMYPRTHLMIVGAANRKKFLEELQSEVDRLGLRDSVTFLGNRRDIASLLQKAHCTIMPSVSYETFGRVIIEAQSCGSVVVATNTGAQGEIIQDGANGFLVSPQDSEALADRIIAVLSDREKAKTMSMLARRIVEEKYTLERIGPQMVELYNRVRESPRILVVKLSSLGDVVLSVAALKSLKRRFPRGSLSVLVLRKFMKVLEGVEGIDEIIPFEGDPDTLRARIAMGTSIRSRAFDYIVDLQNNRCSHMVTFLGAPRFSCGFNRKWGFILHKKAFYRKGEKIDPLQSQQKILGLLGVTLSHEDLVLSAPTEWLEQTERLCEEMGIKKDDFLVGVHVGASASWPTKNWPVSAVNRLIHLICKEKKAKIVLTGDDTASARSRKVSESIHSDNVVDLCGKTTLQQFVGIVGRCRVFIAPDTAALHIAVSQKIPTIALFGPTDPLRHSIRSAYLRVINKKMRCSYCYAKRCRRQPPEEAAESLCMKKITPQEVYAVIKDVV